MPPEGPTVAFHAPLKPPDHPTPSGDRTIARLIQQALARAGFTPVLASRLRTLDRQGDGAVQAALRRDAAAEIARLRQRPAPALWFTYHSHYKAPDLIGPKLAAAWRIPYVIAEPSHAPARLHGAWQSFAAENEAALQAATRLCWTTPRDYTALAGLVSADKLVALPAFLDVGDLPAPRPGLGSDGRLRLLTVAMMREGDKLASYRALAAALHHVSVPFTLSVVGDGPARGAVETVLAPFSPCYIGQIDDPAHLRAVFAEASLFVWPGIGEGVGMVYLEAQAAGLACIAEDRPAQAALLAPACWRTVPDDPGSMAAAIDAAAADPAALAARGAAARAHVKAHHSLDAAAARFRETLWPLLNKHR